MDEKKPTPFITPMAVMRCKQEAWAKLERTPFPEVDLTKMRDISYFDNPHVYQRKQEYDHFFAYTKPFPLFDKRKIRDNRPYLPDIRNHIHDQEKRKVIPALSSQVYGKRPQYDFPAKQFNRQAEIASLYRRSGIMPPIEREVQ